MEVKIKDGKIVFDSTDRAIGCIWRSQFFDEQQWISLSFTDNSKQYFADFFSAVEYLERVSNKW
jgi:hypothetical protein